MNTLKNLIAWAQGSSQLHNAEDVVGMAALGAVVTGTQAGLGPQALLAGVGVAVVRTGMKLLPALETQANTALQKQVSELTNRLTAVEHAPAPAPSPTQAEVERMIADALAAATASTTSLPTVTTSPAAPALTNMPAS